jgi:hypothetical protein
MMKKNFLIPLIILSLALSVFSTQGNIANAAQVIDSVLTNFNPDNYICGDDLPLAVSSFDASRDYAVYLYVLVKDIKLGDTDKVIWYYKGKVYEEAQQRNFNQAGDFCVYKQLIIKGEQPQCMTGNWSVQYYLNDQKAVTKTFYLQGMSCDGGGSCVAEAVLENDKEILDVLRKFRDGVLMKTEMGTMLVKLYNEYSPIAVKFIEDKPEMKERLKQIIKTLIKVLNK